MGQLVEGVWKDQWYDTDSNGGEFVRDTSRFRSWVTPDGAPGPTGEGGFAAESGRYHLYVSHACPWAHRTMIFRALKGLDDHIGVSVVHPEMLSEGWEFRTDFDGATGDRQFGYDYLREVYLRAQPDASGRVTVPVLWDSRTNTIVSNESADIIRMFNSAFDRITGNRDDYHPEDLRPRIDDVNARIYDTVNNGVYKAGFATSQQAYDKAVGPLFESLDWIEGLLGEGRYLTGDRITEADWRLFTSVLRFDAVYHTHFKCNRRRIVDYPNLWGWARELYQWPGVAGTVHRDHFMHHYYYSHDMINPHRIVPIGPDADWNAPHGR
ncbi:glutathione S-transferase family protein [Paracoccus sp. 1_MG-2023]|uniref:glutathione S-transferase family protein n=1 Tax=unclassified Paracoccus (in: a-proteobacteria) TaxID=2688777 RepID=UPI001C087AE1|nr:MULTISPECIES: glutathione S-transferase family protein [unclassified Paracoccus (in: a-proteobacteria)]MBU2957369.1 glutathione S-transferase family protein [Paracoccus sp. C2R09]MDO6670131.1 glutathione S-transferase family protein [Paracoccus sp. 1_MG-2023]